MKDARAASPGIRHPRQVLAAQLVLSVVVALAALALGGQGAAEAALYGVLTALANTGLLMWRLRQGVREGSAARRPLAGAYRSSLERFALVALLLGLGMGVLGLQPFALTVGFALGQLGWFIAPVLNGTNT